MDRLSSVPIEGAVIGGLTWGNGVSGHLVGKRFPGCPAGSWERAVFTRANADRLHWGTVESAVRPQWNRGNEWVTEGKANAFPVPRSERYILFLATYIRSSGRF